MNIALDWWILTDVIIIHGVLETTQIRKQQHSTQG